MNVRRCAAERTLALLAWGAFVALGACRDHARSQRVPASGVNVASRSPAGAGPLLQIDSPRFDFGTVLQGDALYHSFAIDNRGQGTLELAATTDALGCSGVISPHSLPPGERARLEVTCRFEYYGPMHLALPIRSLSGADTPGQLELSANVTPLLAFATPLLSLRMPFGEERSADVYLKGALLERAKLRLTSSMGAEFSVRPLPPRVGVAPGFRVHVKGTSVGVHVGNLVFASGLARPRELLLPYSCDVVGNLEITPSTPYFDLRAPGAHSVEVTIRSTNPGFAVRAVRVAQGPFSASFAPDAAQGTYRISVLARAEASDVRGAVGRLVIVSNDPAEPSKELPLFAFGPASPNP